MIEIWMYQGCRVCGQNVIHLDGKCNAVIPSGIRDSSHRPQANVAQGLKANHNVLFEDNDWRGEAFHLLINIDASILMDWMTQRRQSSLWLLYLGVLR